ncbi:MAG: peptidoglycan editing factor PgeF [Anaerolineales bacterium]
MQPLTIDGLTCYQFESFAGQGVAHAVFARHGGVSPQPYASLNMSVSTGDTPENVRENRGKAFRALGRAPESVADLWQVHSADVIIADAPNGERKYLAKADTLLTDRPDVTLFLRFADCVPILLLDPRRRVVGVVDAGWRGTLKLAAAAAVAAMCQRYGSRPADLLAGIGPSIGPCHYAVGAEVVAETRQVFGPDAEALLPPVNGGHHLDLWAANEAALRRAGVGQVEVARLCTFCHSQEFFSHRAQGSRTGRFGALIGLQ